MGETAAKPQTTDQPLRFYICKQEPTRLIASCSGFFFLAASKCHSSLQTTTATTTTVLSLLCSAALLPLCRWQPVDREPPSHQQLWWEMCPLPPFPASCPHPPPLHKGLPKGGRHLGSACVLQPSSAQLHTGKHNTHTHTHIHTHIHTHTGRRPHKHMDTDTGIEGYVVLVLPRFNTVSCYQASRVFVFFIITTCQIGRKPIKHMH